MDVNWICMSFQHLNQKVEVLKIQYFHIQSVLCKQPPPKTRSFASSMAFGSCCVRLVFISLFTCMRIALTTTSRHEQLCHIVHSFGSGSAIQSYIVVIKVLLNVIFYNIPILNLRIFYTCINLTYMYARWVLDCLKWVKVGQGISRFFCGFHGKTRVSMSKYAVNRTFALKISMFDHKFT